mgnify:CR=1 FL=1
MLSSWALVAIVAIIAGTISSYYQSKTKSGKETDKFKEEFDSLRSEMENLTQRIQNLEAIAANDPEGFKAEKEIKDKKSFDVDMDDIDQTESSRKNVSRIANQLKNKG